MARKITKPYKQEVSNCVYFDPVERIQIGFDEYQWILIRSSHNTYHGTLQSLINRFVEDEVRDWPFMTDEDWRRATGVVTERFLKIAHGMDLFRKEFIKEQNAKKGEILNKRLGRK